jgi:hypothetical protein
MVEKVSGVVAAELAHLRKRMGNRTASILASLKFSTRVASIGFPEEFPAVNTGAYERFQALSRCARGLSFIFGSSHLPTNVISLGWKPEGVRFL